MRSRNSMRLRFRLYITFPLRCNIRRTRGIYHGRDLSNDSSCSAQTRLMKRTQLRTAASSADKPLSRCFLIRTRISTEISNWLTDAFVVLLRIVDDFRSVITNSLKGIGGEVRLVKGRNASNECRPRLVKEWH